MSIRTSSWTRSHSIPILFQLLVTCNTIIEIPRTKLFSVNPISNPNHDIKGILRCCDFRIIEKFEKFEKLKISIPNFFFIFFFDFSFLEFLDFF